MNVNTSATVADDFSFISILSAITSVLGDEIAIVDGSRKITWTELHDRVLGFASTLETLELGLRMPRRDLRNFESGQDHLAICMYNSAEFLIAYLGACAARLAPLNVNYKYTSDELKYLLIDSKTRVIAYDSVFAPTIGRATEGLAITPALIESTSIGKVQLQGARSFEECEELATDQKTIKRLINASSPDDVVLLYTGGTTGMPKGVMWRQGDLFVQALGGRNYRDGGQEWLSLEALTEATRRRRGPRLMAICPFMHGTGLWTALQTLFSGGTLVIPMVRERLDANSVISAVDAEQVEVLVLVGDAFLRPLVEELNNSKQSLPSLRHIISSGAAISPANKEALLRFLPQVKIKNVLGSSESGPQAEESSSANFEPRFGTVILSEDKQRVLPPHEISSGWLATSGRIPLGYLNDEPKTSTTFPVIDGVRYSVPGDRVEPLTNGKFRLLGRNSMTINTGGEKVFAEEVESAIKNHPAVIDALVVGRPNARWGNEIVAIVAVLTPATTVADLLDTASTVIARYKLPKEVIFVEKVLRSPAGKGDYAWARSLANRTDKGPSATPPANLPTAKDFLKFTED